MVRAETNPHVVDADKVYLIDILLDVAKASGHTFEYVRNDLGWLTMWSIWFSVTRKRDRLAEAARDNPMAALALYMGV